MTLQSKHEPYSDFFHYTSQNGANVALADGGVHFLPSEFLDAGKCPNLFKTGGFPKDTWMKVTSSQPGPSIGLTVLPSQSGLHQSGGYCCTEPQKAESPSEGRPILRLENRRPRGIMPPVEVSSRLSFGNSLSRSRHIPHFSPRGAIRLR